VARLPEAFDPTRPTNKVEAGADWAGVSRGLAYEQCRSGAWPCVRVGTRLLILTKPFLAMFPPADA
jgi:hypothetical protein